MAIALTRKERGFGKDVSMAGSPNEVLELCGADYTVESGSVSFSPNMGDDYDGPEIFHKVPGAQAIYRTDTMESLGLHGGQYRTIQNDDLINAFSDIVDEGHATWSRAGTFNSGAAFWAQAKLPNGSVIGRDDLVDSNIMILNSHDGTNGAKILFTNHRMACANELNVVMKNIISSVTIRHSGNIHFKIEYARKVLGLANEYFTKFKEVSDAMSRVQMTGKMVTDYFDSVIYNTPKLIKDKEEGTLSTRATNLRNNVEEMFEGEANGSVSTDGTLWAAFNAVGEFVDHNRDSESNQKSAMLGSGARRKQFAWDTALEMMNTVQNSGTYNN